MEPNVIIQVSKPNVIIQVSPHPEIQAHVCKHLQTDVLATEHDVLHGRKIHFHVNTTAYKAFSFLCILLGNITLVDCEANSSGIAHHQ
jgi:hypothetical protein